MATVLLIALAYVPFILAALSISHAAWPKLQLPLKAASSLMLGGILLLCHLFLLISTRSGITLGGLSLAAVVWFAAGVFAHLALKRGVLRPISERMRSVPVLSKLAGFSLSDWVAALAVIFLVISLLIFPLVLDLKTGLPWRYRSYMLALLGTALVGAALRKKLLTVLIGAAAVLLPSLLFFSAGQYPVATPLLEANAMIQESVGADLPVLGDAGIDQIVGLLAPFAFASDVVIALLSVAFIGISSVVLTNALMDRGTGRTVLALLLVLLLLVPGLLFPYVYALAVGGTEFTASLGSGALKGYGMVQTLQTGEMSNETLASLRQNLVSAGESFSRAETLLLGLEQLRLFGFLGALPGMGAYSPTGRGLAWGLSEAANGLQVSALGIIDLLGGVLTAFGASDGEGINTYDLLGPRILDRDLDESRVSKGIDRIDAAFGQVRLGFPRIRASLGNFSRVDPAVFEPHFPQVADSLEEVLSNTRDLEAGIDVADVFLSDRTNPTTATHFIYAAYSIAKVAPNLTDLREVGMLPSLDEVTSNLSYVSDALDDPAIVSIRLTGGDVGEAVDFVADAIDLINRIAGLGEDAFAVAADVDAIKERFESKEVYNLTDVEVSQWSYEAEALVQKAETLGHGLGEIEDAIGSMLSRAARGGYGHANELATSGVQMLEDVLDFIADLRDLEDFSYGLRSLVNAMASFNDFYEQMVRLDRQIAAGNLGGAMQIAAEASINLREGRLLAEELLGKVEEVSDRIQLPITEEDVGRIVEAAAEIELDINALMGHLGQGDQESSTRAMSEVKDTFVILAQELQLPGLTSP